MKDYTDSMPSILMSYVTLSYRTISAASVF